MSRKKSQRVRTARGRKSASTRWLNRQLNDPYVQEAKRKGYRSRSAFKLQEIDDKLGLIKTGCTVVDLGAAPGGWSQMARQRGAKNIVALDLLPIDPLEGVTSLQMDFMKDDAPETLIDIIGGGVDIVLSDMAPNTTGHQTTDHLKIMALAEAAYEFAADVLKPGGAFVAKVFSGGAQQELLDRLKADFETVKHVKPPASRKESPEMYVAGIGFKRSDRA